MAIDAPKNTYSDCPFQIITQDSNGKIGGATGFLYDLDGERFVITNWHVVAGRDWHPRSSSARTVRTLRMFAKFAQMSPDGNSYQFVAQELQIYSNGVPLWYEHPQSGSRFDVVAIPLEDQFTEVAQIHTPVNLTDKVPIPVRTGIPMFVVGFPLSISVGPGLPVWKSGYLASEPGFNVRLDGELASVGGLANAVEVPAVFIDSLTREGMSGSPVFASYVGVWNPEDPYAGVTPNNPNNQVGSAMKFIGCYSGRALGEKETDAALGLCWHDSVIREICEGRKQADV